ncbi:MAG: hypothetical protein ACOCSE_00715 [Chitinivibrionales bacterium]
MQGCSDTKVSSKAGLEKVLAPEDTLFVSAYGYEDKVYPIEEYTDGLNIELTELNGDDSHSEALRARSKEVGRNC